MNLLVTSITSAVLLTGISDSYDSDMQLDRLHDEHCAMACIGDQSVKNAKANVINIDSLSEPFHPPQLIDYK